jgi:hypothetical protein
MTALVAIVLACVVLAGCGGERPPERSATDRAQTAGQAQAAPSARPQRVPVRLTRPALGEIAYGHRRGDRLTAVMPVAGRAAPGALVEIIGRCGRLDCSAIALADRRGRWRAQLQLTVARGGDVALRVAYAEPKRGDRPVRRLLRLRPAANGVLPAAGGRPAATGPGTMVVIGDSLAVGMASALQAELDGWQVSVDGRIGRPLGEGMQILQATPWPPGGDRGAAVLAFSLFTNDSPGSVDALEAAVRTSLARARGHGCVIWATIARPPYGGVGYDAANQRLGALAVDPAARGRLLLVDWKREYDAHPGWRAGDGVHATAEGYAARARLYADAARTCPAR